MPTILVVEDEPAIASSLQYALATEGFTVVLASTLAHARLELAQPIALVVLDVGLPDGSGFDFCRELRRHSTVPVLFLSARSSEIDRVVGLELGADDYVAKPFSPREVSARVRAILRRSAEVRAPLAGPLTLDPERRRAVYFDQVLDLSPQQYRLLEVLAQHPGRILSRSRLLDLAWDDPGAASDRAVDSQVKVLRAAFHAVRPGVEAILTLRGEGYGLTDAWPA